MNYRTIFLKDALINISSMAKYIIEETNEYAVVEFDDEKVFEFFEDFKSAFDLRASKLKEFDTIDCVGEDNHIYIISYNGIDYVRFKDAEFVDAITNNRTSLLTVYGRANLNEWMGNISLQFFIDDYELEIDQHKYDF